MDMPLMDETGMPVMEAPEADMLMADIDMDPEEAEAIIIDMDELEACMDPDMDMEESAMADPSAEALRSQPNDRASMVRRT